MTGTGTGRARSARSMPLKSGPASLTRMENVVDDANDIAMRTGTTLSRRWEESQQHLATLLLARASLARTVSSSTLFLGWMRNDRRA